MDESPSWLYSYHVDYRSLHGFGLSGMSGTEKTLTEARESLASAIRFYGALNVVITRAEIILTCPECYNAGEKCYRKTRHFHSRECMKRCRTCKGKTDSAELWIDSPMGDVMRESMWALRDKPIAS